MNSRDCAFQWNIPGIVAQSGSGGRLFGDVFPWLLLLTGIVIVGGIVIYVLRRRLHNNDFGPSPGFTLQELRDLHAAGDLSDEEFEKARSMMIGRVNAASSDKDSGANAEISDKRES